MPTLKNRLRCAECGTVVSEVSQNESAARRMRKHDEALRKHKAQNHGGSKG